MGIQPLELRSDTGEAQAASATSPFPSPRNAPSPQVRAARAWLSLKVSPILGSLAFLARGVERGRAPRAAACPKHILGPLIGTLVGPVGGPLPQDSIEEFHQRASHVRRVTVEEWVEWRRSRFSAELLADLTMLAYKGSCADNGDRPRCSCTWTQPGGPGEPRLVNPLLRTHPSVLGSIPALTPDPSGRTDPWHDALAELASRYRGRGSPPESRFSGIAQPSTGDVRTLTQHLERLANAFAGPRRVDRMAGLSRVEWQPALRDTQLWQLRDRASGTVSGREELTERLMSAARL